MYTRDFVFSDALYLRRRKKRLSFSAYFYCSGLFVTAGHVLSPVAGGAGLFALCFGKADAAFFFLLEFFVGARGAHVSFLPLADAKC